MDHAVNNKLKAKDMLEVKIDEDADFNYLIIKMTPK